MPFRQRDRRPGRLRRSGGFVKASGASVPSPSISVTGTTSVLIRFNSSDPAFTVLGISGPIHQQSESFIKTTDLSPNLKGAAKIDSRQKGSIFALTPSFGALPSNGATVIKNASSFRRGVVGGGGNGQSSAWSGGGGGGAAYDYDPSGVAFDFSADKTNKLLEYKFTGSATIGSASGTSSLQLTNALGVDSPTRSAPGGASGTSSHPTGSGGGGGVPGIGPSGASTVGEGSGGPKGNNGYSATGGWPGCGAVPSSTCYAGGGGGAAAAATDQNGGAGININPQYGEPGSYVVCGGGGGGGWGPGGPYPYGDGWPSCPGRARNTSSGNGPNPTGGPGGGGNGRGVAATANTGGGGGGCGNGGTGSPSTGGAGGTGVCFLRIA